MNNFLGAIDPRTHCKWCGDLMPSTAVPVEERTAEEVTEEDDAYGIPEDRQCACWGTPGCEVCGGSGDLADAVPIPEERTAEMERLLGRLRTASRRAGGDKWHYDRQMFILDSRGQIVAEPRGFGRGMDLNIAEFIAEASPENILKLLDHIEGKAK